MQIKVEEKNEEIFPLFKLRLSKFPECTPLDDYCLFWEIRLSKWWYILHCLFFCATLSMCKILYEENQRFSILLIPGRSVGCDFEAAGVANEFVKDADNLVKLRTVIPLLLPAVQHQLIECGRAIHGWWQAVTLIYSFYYLQARTHWIEINLDKVSLKILFSIVLD